MQPHTILLWAEPEKENIEETIKKGKNIILTIKKIIPEFEPHYVRRTVPDNITNFTLEIDDFKSILLDNINKEGNNIFIEAGYNIDFFSNLDHKRMVAIYLHIGISFPLVKNSLIIKFSNVLDIYNSENKTRIENLFKKLIPIFKPFGGCISNDINSKRIDKYIKNNKPTAVHWFNFWGSKLLNELNISNWENAPIEEYEQINDGYFIKLKKEPIDDENENDLLLQQNANRFFNLI